VSKIPLAGPSGIPVKVVVKGADGRDIPARDLAPQLQGRLDQFTTRSRMLNAPLPGASAVQQLPEGELRYTKNFGLETVVFTLRTPEPVAEPEVVEPEPSSPWDWVIIEAVVRDLADDPTDRDEEAPAGDREDIRPYQFTTRAFLRSPEADPTVPGVFDPIYGGQVYPIEGGPEEEQLREDNGFLGPFMRNDRGDADPGQEAEPGVQSYPVITSHTGIFVPMAGIGLTSLRADLRSVQLLEIELEGKIRGGRRRELVGVYQPEVGPPELEYNYPRKLYTREVELWWVAGYGEPPDPVADFSTLTEFGADPDRAGVREAYRSYRQWVAETPLDAAAGPPKFHQTQQIDVPFTTTVQNYTAEINPNTGDPQQLPYQPVARIRVDRYSKLVTAEAP
jgi:hypothetical protein